MKRKLDNFKGIIFQDDTKTYFKILDILTKPISTGSVTTEKGKFLYFREVNKSRGNTGRHFTKTK